MKAIDVSAAPPPTQQQVRCLLDEGYTKVFVGTSWKYGGDPEARIAAYEKGGMDVAEYQFPNAWHETAREWWLDVEMPPGTTPSQVQRCIDQAVNKPTGIYTSQNEWAKNCPGWDIVAEYPYLKLWTANYGPLPRPFTPYGGWEKPSIVQFSGTTQVCGIDCDLNLIEEEDVTEADIDKIVDRVKLVVLQSLGTIQSGDGDTFKKNISDLAHDGGNRTVDLMVQRGQVQPPK